MNNPKINFSKSRNGEDFLHSLKFLYNEALRLKSTKLIDILEKAFDDCAAALHDEGVDMNEKDFIELYFLRKFRTLDIKQQLLFLEFIENTQITHMKQ